MGRYTIGLVIGAFLWSSCGVEEHNQASMPAAIERDRGDEPELPADLVSSRGMRPLMNEDAEFPEFKNLRDFFRSNIHKGKSSSAAIAIMGGFNSCSPGPYGTGIFQKALTVLKRKAAEGQYFRFVVSCFKKSSKKVYYYSSADLDVLKWGPISDVASMVQREASQTKVSGVYLIGHSWGGWLAMKTLLALPQHIDVHGLATIDPISQENCNIPLMLKAYSRSVYRFNPERGCTEGPADITNALRRYIDRRSDWWHNFYQTNSGYLHSGYMTYAQNHYIDYNFTHFWEIFNAHIAMDNDNRVWSKFEGQLRSSL